MLSLAAWSSTTWWKEIWNLHKISVHHLVMFSSVPGSGGRNTKKQHTLWARNSISCHFALFAVMYIMRKASAIRRDNDDGCSVWQWKMKRDFRKNICIIPNNLFLLLELASTLPLFALIESTQLLVLPEVAYSSWWYHIASSSILLLIRRMIFPIGNFCVNIIESILSTTTTTTQKVLRSSPSTIATMRVRNLSWNWLDWEELMMETFFSLNTLSQVSNVDGWKYHVTGSQRPRNSIGVEFFCVCEQLQWAGEFTATYTICDIHLSSSYEIVIRARRTFERRDKISKLRSC